MHYLIIAIFSYLVGSFPTGVVLTRRKYGLDVREMGSGNIGATNVTRVFGWYAGVMVLVADFLKGLLPILLVRRFYPEDLWLLAVVGISLVVGHCFSAYLKLHGGKGVATSLGCLLAVSPWAAAWGAGSYLTLLLVTRISAVGSLGGIIAVLLYLILVQPQAHVTALVLGIALIVVVRHRSNIQRLWNDWESRKK